MSEEIKARVVTLTKEIVDAYLSTNTSNRKIKKDVVARYSRDMAEGRWPVTCQGIGVSEEGILIDGQHRLLACKDAGYPQIQTIIVTGLKMESQRVVDQGTKRTARDVFALSLNLRVSRVMPAICSALFRIQPNGEIRKSPSVSELYDVFEKHSEIIEEISLAPTDGGFFAAAYLAGFVRSVIDGVSIQKVKEFIKMVECGENLNKTMPAFHLRNNVMFSKGARGGGTTQAERMLKCIKATKAFDSGETMGVLKV